MFKKIKAKNKYNRKAYEKMSDTKKILGHIELENIRRPISVFSLISPIVYIMLILFCSCILLAGQETETSLKLLSSMYILLSAIVKVFCYVLIAGLIMKVVDTYIYFNKITAFKKKYGYK